MTRTRLQLEWTGLAGSPYLSTFYFNDNVSTTLAAQVNGLYAALAEWTDVVSSGLTVNFTGEAVQYLTPDQPTGVVVYETPPPTPGQDGGTEQARAAQGLVKWATGVYIGARQVQGRTFIPGSTAGFLGVDGRPNAPYRAALNAGAALLVPLGLSIASRKNNQFYDVESGAAWSEYAVLRSRRD